MTEFASSFTTKLQGGFSDRQYRVVVDTTMEVAPEDSWSAWVSEPVRAFLLGVRDRLNAGGLDVVTVVIRMREPKADYLTGIATAALEGLRGSVGSAALELGPDGVRANLVVVDEAADVADVEATISYLESQEDGGYTSGATLHIGREWTPLRPAAALPPLPATGRVLVTGAAGGLGFGSASLLAEQGYEVLLSDLPGQALDRAAESLSAPAYAAEVTDAGAVDQLAQAVATEGPLRALAVLHGVGTSGAIKDLADDVLDRSLRINAHAVRLLVERFASEFAPAGGSIVVLSSQAGIHAEEFNSAYCAAKFAAVGLARGWSAWLAEGGVRIHAVCPGPIDTPLMRSAFTTMAAAAGVTYDEYLQGRLDRVPLRCTGTVRNLAASTALLIRLHGSGTVLAPSGAAVLT